MVMAKWDFGPTGQNKLIVSQKYKDIGADQVVVKSAPGTPPVSNYSSKLALLQIIIGTGRARNASVAGVVGAPPASGGSSGGKPPVIPAIVVYTCKMPEVKGGLGVAKPGAAIIIGGACFGKELGKVEMLGAFATAQSHQLQSAQ